MLRLLVLILIVLAGGALPLFVRRSDRALHLLVAFATGIFLGVVFLHLLPEVALRAEGAGHAADPEHAHGDTLVWACVLVGVLAVFLVENLVLRSGRDRHATVSWASLVGLGIHSFLSGVGLAAADTSASLSSPVYVSLLTHKGPEAFSLATVFLLAGFGRAQILGIVAAFSLVTPAGALLGDVLVASLPPEGLLALLGLATGTFLFVALCDLLPEVFHHEEDGRWKVLLLVAGVLASTQLAGLFGA